jgi:CheY-like chemotaxis protein
MSQGFATQMEKHGPLLGKRILVADDNVDAGDMLALVLSELGADVYVTRSGPDALAALPAFNPSVVLLDVGMPEMSGYDVAREIRTRYAGDITLIAVTGWTQPADVQRAQEAGFDHHLSKPTDVHTLQSLIA